LRLYIFDRVTLAALYEREKKEKPLLFMSGSVPEDPPGRALDLERDLAVVFSNADDFLLFDEPR
jgi:hypothetical protein